MLSDLARAFAMFSDRSVRRTFLLSLGVTVLLLAAMFPAADALLASAGATGYWWLDKLLEIAGLFGTAVLALFLFPTAVAAVLGFLLDAVVEATERRHFPALPPAEGPPFLTNLVHSLGFALLVLGLNVLALPLYLVPGLNLPVYLLLNSYLLGREYVELVLARRQPHAALPALRRRHQRQLWLGGLVTALMLPVPVLNLLAPIVGSAFVTLRAHRAGVGALAISANKQIGSFR
jgi:uncharacterized protein involved in cysteine biosynthesis